MEDMIENTGESVKIEDVFKQLLCSIENGEALFNYLVNETNFCSSPASMKYHSSFYGGLMMHSVYVYDELKRLVELRRLPYTEETIIKVALCHDLGKIGLYEEYMKNEKRDGQWVSVPSYRMTEGKTRYTAGDSGLTSYMIASRFLSFTDEEIITLCNYAHLSNIKTYPEVNVLLSKYPLIILLHEADLVATYMYEEGE